MIGVQEQAAVELLEQRMDNTFGTFFDQEEAKTVGPIAKAYLNAAIRVVDNSGVVPQLMEWDRKRRKSNAGRKADIPYRAVLVLFLLHAQCGMGVTYNDLANTLDIRFTMEHFELLSIQDRPGDRGDWYVRLWAAANRMMKLIDPYPIARNRHMSAKKIERWHAKAETEKGQAKIQAKMARLDWLMEQLVHASVKLLPADILARAKGNLAIDATFVGTAGRPNPKGFTDKRRNADPFSGRYRRQGKHDGRGAKTDKAGYELETGVLVWNEPGGKGHFPSLVTSVSMHRPGELVGHGANLAASHRRLGFENFILLCDRAYNGERVENFHIPLRMMGVQPVFDYKKNTFGLQSTYEDVILVDGTWYVTYMPQSNIDAVKNYRNGLPDPETKQLLDKETLENRIASREQYRMIPKGRPDADGYQRYSYPKPGYMAIDRATGKRVKPKTAASITIPLLAGLSDGREKDRQKPAIKHWQKFPYRSDDHKRWYGMRSLVESSNKTLKSKRFEDMGNTGKRSGRGFTFHYLVATLMVVSANIRKIVAFFLKDAVCAAGGPLTRVRRRKNPNGARLEKRTTAQATAPPQ